VRYDRRNGAGRDGAAEILVAEHQGHTP
jgi:hypothetical protein